MKTFSQNSAVSLKFDLILQGLCYKGLVITGNIFTGPIILQSRPKGDKELLEIIIEGMEILLIKNPSHENILNKTVTLMPGY